MKFNIETLGSLVRPRVLTKARVIPQANRGTGHYPWGAIVKHKPYEIHNSLFNKIASKIQENIFSTLSLGDTTLQDTSKTYVCKVTHYLVGNLQRLTLVDKDSAPEALEAVKKRLGVRSGLQIALVGVKTYRGFQRDLKTQKLEAVDPWQPEEKSITEDVLFFAPWELASLEDIIKFEKVSPGDLIVFPKANALVIKKKKLNKPRFYNNSSWTCYGILLLNGSGNGFSKLVPARAFNIHRS